MKLTAKQLNKFIIFKLPSAFLCGVRVLSLTEAYCTTKVKFRWINQNPFQSIYFAVLAMAAELASGALVLGKTQETSCKFSTLVLGVNASFTKKAIGTIVFTCPCTKELQAALQTAIQTKEGVAFNLKSVGVDEDGDEVASFEFRWSIKLKSALVKS